MPNFLQPIEFEFSVKRLPSVEFTIQRASIPAINIGFVTQPNMFSNVFHSGDKMEFSELTITFIVSESLSNYLEIFNWMTGLAFPQSTSQYKNLKNSDFGLYSDMSLLIKTAGKNPNHTINFKNAFPISLSEIMFDTTATDLIYPEATVSFKYDSFSIETKTTS